MNRRFGIEMEIYGISRSRAVSAINAAGIRCADEGYTHATHTHWKIVTDNSVRVVNAAGMTTGNGFEVVSPILHGEAGLAEARKVATALRSAGAKANKSCGLHVHVDAHDFTPKHLRNFLVNYMKFEGVFDEILAPSRRGNTNVYMKSNRQTLANFCGGFPQAVERLRKCRTKDEVIQLMHSDAARQPMDRFFKLNLIALRVHGTVEFRHHQGTVDPVKIVAWIKLLERFVNSSVKAKPRWWNSARITENEIRQRFFEQMNAEDLRRYYQARRRHFIGKPRKGDDLILSGVDPLTVGSPVPGSAETAEPEAEQSGVITHHRTGRSTPEALSPQIVAEAHRREAEAANERIQRRAIQAIEQAAEDRITVIVETPAVPVSPEAQATGEEMFSALTRGSRRRNRSA